MGRIVVNPELVAYPVLLADPVERDPCAGGIRDVVVPIVAYRPPRHWALLNAVDQSARFRLSEHRNEVLLNIEKVLIHAMLLVPADKSADRINAELGCRV